MEFLKIQVSRLRFPSVAKGLSKAWRVASTDQSLRFFGNQDFTV
jgi:hypothetical protein